jgi:hypothetical protein
MSGDEAELFDEFTTQTAESGCVALFGRQMEWDEEYPYLPPASMNGHGRAEPPCVEFHDAEILQISKDNMCLAIMLTLHEHFRPEKSGKQWDVVRGCLGKKRKEILQWLGWPGEEWCVHLLSKIKMDGVDIEDLLNLRAACHEGMILPRLRHLPIINGGIIRVVTDAELAPLVTDSFLRTLGAIGVDWGCLVSPLLRYAVNKARHLDEECPLFSSMEQAFVYVLEDNAQAVAEIFSMQYETNDLPQPPFTLASGRQPARFELEPVRSINDLYQWAEAQKNCAFFKIDEIFAGRLFLFKVRRPVRGTLSLVLGADGEWRMGAFEQAANKPVSRALFFEMAAHLNRCMERVGTPADCL